MVVLGGNMYVEDRYKEGYEFLEHEFNLMEEALDEGKPILGICLGGQMLAHLLGAELYEGASEVGWYPIHIVKDDPIFDTIDLTTSEGSLSENTPSQGKLLNRRGQAVGN